jgi:hypothetical protein
MYFGPEVDLSIIRYNESTSDFERSIIFQQEIKPAFEKLAENIIHTFKFYYTDGETLQQLQHEVVSFLAEKLPKFKQKNGKAFSYFSIVAKNFCILKNKKNYKKLISHDRVSLTEEDILESVSEETHTEYSIVDFVDKFVEYWDDNLESVFTKKGDRLLAASIIELFRKRESIELFNKKALYIYIREMSDANTQQITKMVKTMKLKYKTMYMDYLKLGYVQKNKLY